MKTYVAKKNTAVAKYVSDGKWDDEAAAVNSFLVVVSVICKIFGAMGSEMFSVLGIEPLKA